MEKKLQYLIVACFIVMAGSIFYYLVIFLPAKETQKNEIILQSEKDLEVCLKVADRTTAANVESVKEKFGLESQTFKLVLAKQKTENEKLRDECYRRWK